MSNTTPIRGKNAIDQIAFVIVFKKPLVDRDLLELLGLRDDLSQELPDFKKIDVVQMAMDPSNPRLPVSKLGGMSYGKKSIKNESRFEWSLRIENNNIIVACSEYTKWLDVWVKAKEYLNLALEKCDVSGNPVVELVFQCMDKFINSEHPDNYTIEDVFDINSDYLTKHVALHSPKAWHINQGWFQELLDGQIQSLNNLNLNAQIIDAQPHETIISHVIKMKKVDTPEIDNVGILNGGDSSVGYLENAMKAAHILNKSVLLDLLHADMAKTIGLSDQ